MNITHSLLKSNILFFPSYNIMVIYYMFYENINIINNPNDINVLVNKQNQLPDSYFPIDLEPINCDYSINMQYLRTEAKINFEKMCKKAKEEGYIILAVSTYRSGDYQEKLYNNYCLEKGYEYANMCSAKRNHSEHQTGLAVDVSDINGEYDDFLRSKEFEWMKNNSYKYGFILRYPKYKTDITGFKFEPWHYRYVGIDSAKEMHENGITFEEYIKIRK